MYSSVPWSIRSFHFISFHLLRSFSPPQILLDAALWPMLAEQRVTGVGVPQRQGMGMQGVG